MNTKIFGLLGILIAISLVSLADAQISIGENAQQKSVEVMINPNGEVHVKHVIRSSNLPVDLELIHGTVSNISVTNEQGIEELFSMNEDNVVLLQPSKDELIIEYDLDDVLSKINNVWTWDFRYLQTTTFLIPQEIDLFFVNERPVYLDDKRGFACHGCQMILEYSIGEPKNIEYVNWENKEFGIEIRTFAEIEKIDFSQSNKEISFKVNDANQFVTIVIPLELLLGPYQVFLNDEKIFFNKYITNGTHNWINMRPDTTGEISILGTTVTSEPSYTVEVIECGWWDKFLAWFGIGKC
ncbi:MAG: hypothetical protein ISR81_01780 [Nitrosopumilus sp.]|nr:hypothetical protein [Nitrosopumilus sp.]MBL7014978.1 hypothetical protein [Nitrosopumilus sp.]MBL7017626.1 hypothetical protein [Nitrosopumilus sp.]